MSRPDDEPRARRAVRLAAGGAVAGLVVAVASIVHAPAPAVPADAVAVVNDVALPRADYELSLEALARDRRTPLDAADRQHVVDRMIDEELLVQRAFDVGLVRTDRTVRSHLVSAVIAAVTADAESATADDATLRRFYAEHPERFAENVRLRVDDVFVGVPAGADVEQRRLRAEEAAAALRAGEPAAAVRARFGDALGVPVPDTLLPPEKLRDYVGPTAAVAAMHLDVGQVTEPVRGAGGWHVLRVADKQPGTVPPFAAVEPRVLAEWRRQQGEQAMRDYLAGLRADARIAVAPESK